MKNYLMRKIHKMFKRGIALTLCFTLLIPVLSDGTAYAEETDRVKGYAWTRAWGDDDMKMLVEQAENNDINKNAAEKDVRIMIVYDDKYFVSGDESHLDDGEFYGSQLPNTCKINQPYFTTRKSYATPYVKLDADNPYDSSRNCWSFNINMSSTDENGNEEKGKMWLYHENWNFPCIFTYFFTFRNELDEGKSDDEGPVTMKSYREKDIQFEFNSFHERFKMRDVMTDRMVKDYNTDDMTQLTNTELVELQAKAENDCQTLYYMSYWLFEEDEDKYEDLAKFLRDRRDAGEWVAWSPNSFTYTDIVWIAAGALTVLTFGTFALASPVTFGLAWIGTGVATSIVGGATFGSGILCCGLFAGKTGLGSSSHHDYNTGENYLPLLVDSSQNTSFYPSMDLIEDESLVYLSDDYANLDENSKSLADKAYKNDVSQHKDSFTKNWKDSCHGFIEDCDDTDHNEVNFGCTKLHYALDGRGDASWRWDGAKIYASSKESGWNASFKVFIGQPVYLPTVTGNFRVYANQTKILEDINIGKGVVLTVEKGGTLVIRGRVYNEGVIDCQGTVIVESGCALVDEFPFNSTVAAKYGRKYSGGNSTKDVIDGFSEQRQKAVDKSVEDAQNAAIQKSKRGRAQQSTLTQADLDKIKNEVTAQVTREENEAFLSRFSGINKNVNSYEAKFSKVFLTNAEYEQNYNSYVNNKDQTAFNNIVENGRLLPDGSIVVRNGGLFYVQEGALLMMSKDPTLKAYNGGNIIIDGLAACLALVEVDLNSNLEIGPTGELCIGGTVDLEKIEKDGENVYVTLKAKLQKDSLYTMLKVYDNDVAYGYGVGSNSGYEGGILNDFLLNSMGISVTQNSTLSVYGLLELVDNAEDGIVSTWSDNSNGNYISGDSCVIGLDGVWDSATTQCVGIARYQFSTEYK